jgi:hypothetical protein
MSQRNDDSQPEHDAETPPERVGPRAQLPIPVRAKIGHAPSQERRLYDVSVSGCRLEWPDPAEPGEAAIVRFEGYPGVCPVFILHGRVVRVVTGKEPALGIAIDREGSPPEALRHFRQLVLHYMRHKPLLDEIGRDFFEGRCEICDWIGRVGARAPVCPRCGQRVSALDPGQ